MRYKVPLREAYARWQRRQVFDCNGTLRGLRGSPPSTGMLPNEWCQYIAQFRRHIVYTVMSYQTPLAWVMADGREMVPPVKYSQTTGRHLSALGVRWSPQVVADDEEAAAA